MVKVSLVIVVPLNGQKSANKTNKVREKTPKSQIIPQIYTGHGKKKAAPSERRRLKEHNFQLLLPSGILDEGLVLHDFVERERHQLILVGLETVHIVVVSLGKIQDSLVGLDTLHELVTE